MIPPAIATQKQGCVWKSDEDAVLDGDVSKVRLFLPLVDFNSLFKLCFSMTRPDLRQVCPPASLGSCRTLSPSAEQLYEIKACSKQTLTDTLI